MDKNTILFLICLIISFLALSLSITDEAETEYINAYAEGFYHSYDTPIVLSFPAEDIYINVTGFTIQDYYGFTSENDYSVTVLNSGLYKISAQASFSGGNSGEYEAELFIGETPQPDCVFFRSTTSTALGNAIFNCLKQLSIGDTLTIRLKDITSPAQAINLYQLNFNIIEII